jgi:hypothetical protein
MSLSDRIGERVTIVESLDLILVFAKTAVVNGQQYPQTHDKNLHSCKDQTKYITMKFPAWK